MTAPGMVYAPERYIDDKVNFHATFCPARALIGVASEKTQRLSISLKNLTKYWAMFTLPPILGAVEEHLERR
jgi:hypothetical protein